MELRNYILNRVNAKAFYKGTLGKLEGEFYGNVICPFHKDTNPSLQIRDDGSAYCYGCKRGWKDIVTFYMEYKKISLTGALYQIYSDYVEPLISRKRYLAMFYNLNEKKRARAWLLARGIGVKTIRRYLLGYDNLRDRVSLPIFNEWGYCPNIRFLRYKKNNEPKVINYKKGMGRCRLFPYTNLIHKEVYLFEGEMDCLLANHLGLNAMTMTAGAKAWRREFTPLFKDKIVYLCFDNDSDGQHGAKLVAKELKSVAFRLYNIMLPAKFGKDFSDYLGRRPLEAFLDIVTATREVTKQDVRDIKKRKEIVDFAQEESMIVGINKKATLHIIVKVSEDQ